MNLRIISIGLSSLVLLETVCTSGYLASSGGFIGMVFGILFALPLEGFLWWFRLCCPFAQRVPSHK
jgi:hypothetical protein